MNGVDRIFCTEFGVYIFIFWLVPFSAPHMHYRISNKCGIMWIFRLMRIRTTRQRTEHTEDIPKRHIHIHMYSGSDIDRRPGGAQMRRTCKVVALSSPALTVGIKRCLSVTPEREEGEMRSDTIRSGAEAKTRYKQYMYKPNRNKTTEIITLEGSSRHNFFIWPFGWYWVSAAGRYLPVFPPASFPVSLPVYLLSPRHLPFLLLGWGFVSAYLYLSIWLISLTSFSVAVALYALYRWHCADIQCNLCSLLFR